MLVKRGSNLDYFTMDDLFVVLKSADTLEHATTIQDTIKELFKETPNKKLREELDTGIAYLVEGSNENALSTFTKITNSDPSYGEAWNKKATAYYISGYMQESLEAAQKALDIEPRNFQALAGIGLVEMDSSSYENAVDAFQQCLALNPWSLVSARLSQCLRKLDCETKTTNL
jgi:tetratricopeptide (TPR) repeat protein